jgi:hypothetical protein
VAAVVKYHSGVKKLEGRILCTQPIKAPGGEVKRRTRLIQVTQAYSAMTGDIDQTGPPLRFDGSCDIDFYSHGRASVTITALRPDVIFCVGVHCGTSHTLSWDISSPGGVRQTVPIYVFKVPGAPASQLLGGGRSVIDIYFEYYRDPYLEQIDVYVNGTHIAHCHVHIVVSKKFESWTEYKEPNATANYLVRFVGKRPNGTPVVVDANIKLYQRNDGSFGVRAVVRPVDNPTPADLNVASPYRNFTINSPSGTTYYGAVSLSFLREEEETSKKDLHNDSAQMGTFHRFLNWLYNNTQAYTLIAQSLDRAVADIEFNVPYIAYNRTSEYLVYQASLDWRGSTATLNFKTLSLSSFGAVYANAILPIDVRLPPPVLPRNATRTYIFSYK